MLAFLEIWKHLNFLLRFTDLYKILQKIGKCDCDVAKMFWLFSKAWILLQKSLACIFSTFFATILILNPVASQWSIYSNFVQNPPNIYISSIFGKCSMLEHPIWLWNHTSHTKVNSMNLLQMPCVITSWSFLTSEVVEAVRGQKHHISGHTLAL